jgi:RNA methyltransferase, RsmD family
MRVIAGTARSLPLKTPDGQETRPTTDRIKETLFNILQPYLPDCIFLDLFSGSGQIGIEALSRGARHAYFVENGAKAFACIQQNVNFTRFEGQATLLRQEAISALSAIHEKKVDVVFIDPPYGIGHEEKTLRVLGQMPYVTEDTLVIVEAALDKSFSFAQELGFQVEREKQYKTNKHIFLKRQGEER